MSFPDLRLSIDLDGLKIENHKLRTICFTNPGPP